jgi:hypothetical protein
MSPFEGRTTHRNKNYYYSQLATVKMCLSFVDLHFHINTLLRTPESGRVDATAR